MQNQQVHVSKAGYNEPDAAPVDMNDYGINCARCHGDRYPGRGRGDHRRFPYPAASPESEDVRSIADPGHAGRPGRSRQRTDRAPTRTSSIPWRQRLRATPAWIATGARATEYGDDVAPPGGLSFEPAWAMDRRSERFEPLDAPLTPLFPAGVTPDLTGWPMGEGSPYSPGYVMLQRPARRFHGKPQIGAASLPRDRRPISTAVHRRPRPASGSAAGSSSTCSASTSTSTAIARAM